MGIIEDYSLVEKFSDIEETVDIPSYDSISFKGRFFSYRTKIGFGLLGFACSLFVAGRGKIQVHPKSCSLDMTFNLKKQVGNYSFYLQMYRQRLFSQTENVRKLLPVICSKEMTNPLHKRCGSNFFELVGCLNQTF